MPTYCFGECELDTDRHTLRRRGEPVSVSPQPFDLLALLAERGGRVVSAANIHDRLWPQTNVGDVSLRQAVMHARKAIGDPDEKILVTVRGHGYQLVVRSCRPAKVPLWALLAVVVLAAGALAIGYVWWLSPATEPSFDGRFSCFGGTTAERLAGSVYRLTRTRFDVDAGCFFQRLDDGWFPVDSAVEIFPLKRSANAYWNAAFQFRDRHGRDISPQPRWESRHDWDNLAARRVEDVRAFAAANGITDADIFRVVVRIQPQEVQLEWPWYLFRGMRVRPKSRASCAGCSGQWSISGASWGSRSAWRKTARASTRATGRYGSTPKAW